MWAEVAAARKDVNRMHNRLDGEVVIDYLALVCHSRGKDD
jgi:hypothetical protein